MDILHEGRKFGPEPTLTAHCSYLGTEFCHSYCQRGFDLPDDCDLECRTCRRFRHCNCSTKTLPWQTTLETGQQVLVIHPHRPIYHTMRQFYARFGYYPTIKHLEELGLIVCIID